MKLNKKITLLSVAALMTITPLIAVGSKNVPTVLAASRKTQKNTIKLRPSTYSDDRVQLYTRTGAQYSGNRTLKPGSTVHIYGQPIMIKGPKIDVNAGEGFVPTRIIKGQTYCWLGDNGYIKSHNVSGGDNQGNLNVLFNSYIYDKNGKKLKSYRGHSAFVKKNTEIKALEKNYTYNPAMYYNIGHNLYVKASDVARANGRGIMRIGYNSYLYNKNGKRIKGQKKLAKGSVVSYKGKIIPANDDKTAFYFYNGTHSKAHQLKSKTIKGQKYYSLGNGRYINAANVDMINGNYVYTNRPTYVVPLSDMYVLNDKLENTDQVVRRGQKVKVDGAITNGDGDNDELYYRLAGSKNKFLWWGDDSEYPDNTFNQGFYNIRFNMEPSSTLIDLTHSYINFKNYKSTPLYTVNGTKRNLQQKYLYIPSDSNQSADQNYDVDSKWYIYSKATKQTALYYHLRNRVFNVANPHPAKGEQYESMQDVGDSFVKATDVNLNGVKIPTMNTAAEAKSQADAVATASQKDKLNTYISNAAKVRATEKYRLTTKANRDNYDGAIKDAQNAVKDNNATVFEVDELNWLLNKTQKALDGAKVKVNDINNLTANEAARVQKVMANANSSLPGFLDIAIYQHWAHKAGYYSAASWTSSQKSVFMLQRRGQKNQILNVKDYATEK